MDNFSPTSLQYEGFGRFLDIFCGCKDVPGMGNVSSEKLRSAVDKFAGFVSLVYEDEQARMDEGLRALNKIFSARTGGLSFTLMAANFSNNSHSGAHILGPHQAAYCVAEFKNEASASAIPYVEMTGYFSQTIKRAVENCLSPSVMNGWDLPCLGLTIIGPTVTFYAMIFCRRWRVVSLTPGLSCIRASGDSDDQSALYNAFIAASPLLARIREEAVRVVDNPPPAIEGSRCNLPPIASLRRPHSDTRIVFTIVDFFYDRAANRHLYIAKTTEGGQQILVQTTRRYSPELHMFCADRGHAPAPSGFERLPGGFFGIAMEFVESAFPITRSPYVEKHHEWAEELPDLVRSFHAKGLVHRDLRYPNIVCDGNKVTLLAFDWGGKEGEVFYPEGPLSTDLTAGRDNTDLRITKGDDLRVLARTLRYVQMK